MALIEGSMLSSMVHVVYGLVVGLVYSLARLSMASSLTEEELRCRAPACTPCPVP